jgi:hypothetical protein
VAERLSPYATRVWRPQLAIGTLSHPHPKARRQRRAGSSGLALLVAATQRLALPIGGRPLVVVDYGSATGRNSAKPVRTIVDTVRQRAATVPFVIYHNDQPANDFSSLFGWLAGPQSYLQDIDGGFAYASGKSFYERLFPDEYVDIGWSANAVHWLSRVPCTIVDHLCYTRGTPDLDQPFRAQAAEDWQVFFKHRARELRVGGHLVVVVVRVDDEGHSGGDHFVDVINHALVDLLSIGKLRRHEYDRMAIATYFRATEELEAPFRTGSLSRVLRLEAHEQAVLCDPIGEEYDATGDAAAFASAYTGWLRGFSEPSLLGALDPDRPREEVVAFASELYDNVSTRLAREPAKLRCNWELSQLLVTKHARAL